MRNSCLQFLLHPRMNISAYPVLQGNVLSRQRHTPNFRYMLRLVPGVKPPDSPRNDTAFSLVRSS
jgi:hypothetical protein